MGLLFLSWTSMACIHEAKEVAIELWTQKVQTLAHPPQLLTSIYNKFSNCQQLQIKNINLFFLITSFYGVAFSVSKYCFYLEGNWGWNRTVHLMFNSNFMPLKKQGQSSSLQSMIQLTAVLNFGICWCSRDPPRTNYSWFLAIRKSIRGCDDKL